METKRLLLAWLLVSLQFLSVQADVWQDPETKVNYEYEPGSGVAKVKAGSYTGSGSPSVSGILVIPDAVNINGDEYLVKSIGAYAFHFWLFNGGPLTSVTIGNNVTIIEERAFYECSNITSLIIGNSVATIGESAFYGCSSLTSVSIPNSVVTIGNGAFGGCKNLGTVTIPNSVTSIGQGAFSSCTGLGTVTISNSVTTIAPTTFSNCTSLKAVTIPASVTSIGIHAFYNCRALSSLTIGNSVTTIGANAFDNCEALTSVNIPSSVTTIEKNAFEGCNNIVSVHISDIAAWCNISFGDIDSNPIYYSTYNTNNTKAKYLYLGDEEIRDLIIPDGVTSIGDYAFTGFNGLTSVTIPNSVTCIGEMAFEGCTKLTSVHISDIVSWCNISFGYRCWGRNHRLYLGENEIKDLDIPNSVTSIRDYTFSGCFGLTSVNIHNGVTSIGKGAFAGCSGLTSLNIPNSVSSIGNSAFSSCSGLTSLNIPNSITSIGEHMFSGCSSLISLKIPNNIINIDSYAFQYCYSLTSVSIPNSVTSIGREAFNQCYSLREVISYINLPWDVEIEEYTFDSETYSQGTLYVPKNTTDRYRQARCWYLFQNIVEMEEIVDMEAPVLLYTNPKSGAIDVPTTGQLVLLFDEPVKMAEGAKGRLINEELDAEVNDTIVSFEYSRLAFKQQYTFVLPANSVMDLSGNYVTEDIVLTFTTEAPTIATDKQLYQQGETVKISGKVGNAANAEMEVLVSGEGLSQTLMAKIDAEGAFTAEWTPYDGQMGRFAIGVRYDGKDMVDEPALIDVIGLKRTYNGYITCEATVGESFTGEIEVVNPCGIAQRVKAVEVLSKPANCELTTEQPATIEAGSKAKVKYTLTGSAPTEGNDWELVQLRLTTEEGATIEATLYYYCHPAQAVLVANESSISTTMVKGSSRDYPVIITNRGKGGTGKIQVSMPGLQWMTLVTPAEMSSLACGEQTTIMLRLTPSDDMLLNIPQTGIIGVNCENGDGIAIGYSIEAVSDQTGTLTIDVVDEFSGDDASGPHLQGATVEVKHPTTGALLTQGTTDGNGKCSIKLQEGYYSISVTAEKHSAYENYVLVDPGRETTQEVFLSYEAVTASWTMVETEIEDRYEITNTMTFETNVPKPVLVITLPDKKPIPSEVFPIGLKNEGLINTENVSMTGYCTGGFELEILNNEPLAILGPQETHTYYAVIKGDAELWSSSCVTAWVVADGYYQCRGTQHVQSIAYLYYCTQSGGSPLGGTGTWSGIVPPPPFGIGGYGTVTGGATGGGTPRIQLSESVPAWVTLEIKQTMTMNRPAYRGKLTLENGHESMAVTGVGLNIVITDEEGKVATGQEFASVLENLSVFTGEAVLPGDWTLDARKTGTATVLFIPQPDAAPEGPKQYTFKGTLTFKDPFSAQQLTLPLTPFTFTVQPLPELELTYLMQRDIYGDDPLTKGVVEPMEPAEFALIINNKGNGEAKNVKIRTEQPKIVKNDQGLLIDFKIESASVNGETTNVTPQPDKSFVTDFGNIPAQSQSYAQWWLTSTLLGHFISYDVEAVHTTDYGGQNMSLISTVIIHEMVHGFTPTNNAGRGWIVNDEADEADLPDVVYFSDATKQPLHIATGKLERVSDLQYKLDISHAQSGWNYGSVNSTVGSGMKVAKVVRQSDGTELPVDNVWQTDRTLRDGRDWLYENRLHFVGDMTGDSETYLLTFAINDEQSIKDITSNGELTVRFDGERLYVFGGFNEIHGLSVYDLRGVKRVGVSNLTAGQGINVGGLKAGVYYIQVATDCGVYRTKAMKR